ncbi:hypothetical protein [Vibrio mediterranei]|uniref:hypothetical protein n=1 Tax=Vibrio mediterranei TaxID=689 RepID=UPI002284269C|nr:hypothetical protein [Vibrio mediterranei]MCY9855408.1 hypothetical protein [Vibrio mediterranei]
MYHHTYLQNAFTNAASGRNNIVFTGQATDALNTTIDYCVKQSVPLHIMDMARPRLFSKQQKESILSKTKVHERYKMIINHIDKIDDLFGGHTLYCNAAFDILDCVTQHPMFEARQNILIIQHYHNDQCPEWFNELIDNIASYNRFCCGCVLFLDANFD